MPGERKSEGMNRYWVSWHQPTDDYRPITCPPNAAIRGWWCSGYDDEDVAILCALVQAEGQGFAEAAVLADWPEAERWRFCSIKDADWLPGDRFPLDDWMKERADHGNS